jgi:hypothetical protein
MFKTRLWKKAIVPSSKIFPSQVTAWVGFIEWQINFLYDNWSVKKIITSGVVTHGGRPTDTADNFETAFASLQAELPWYLHIAVIANSF